jgi:ABC-type Mn2+/Zn2+ transport system permease subunit
MRAPWRATRIEAGGLLLAAGLAMVAALGGVYLSFYLNVASGASIVLVETLFFGLALLFGPRTDLLSSRFFRRGSVEPA